MLISRNLPHQTTGLYKHSLVQPRPKYVDVDFHTPMCGPRIALVFYAGLCQMGRFTLIKLGVMPG